VSFKFQVSNLKRPAGALLLIGALMVSACVTAKNVVKWSEKGSRYSAKAARIVQGYVDDGSLPDGGKLVTRLNQFSTDAKLLADAFRDGATNTVELAANLTTALDSILTTDINLIPAGAKRTAVMIALAIVDEVLHDIADSLIATANTFRHHAVFGRWVQETEQTKAAKVLKDFAKKPKLRCRDARTGRFLKMEQCKASPDTTVVERVKQ
jgi:hypothetical protein